MNPKVKEKQMDLKLLKTGLIFLCFAFISYISKTFNSV